MRKHKILRFFAIVVFLVIAAIAVVFLTLSRPRPKGVPGADAERIAAQLLKSVHSDDWKQTGAVQFTFLNHRHLWDRIRNFDRIQWGKNTVLLRIKEQSGIASEGNAVLNAEKSRPLIQKAYALWVNDSFWLNPVVKVFDRGVTRGIVRNADGTLNLLVEYSSGGLTPGDAYLWTPGANGDPPTEWRMWAHVLKIKGLPSTWENWITLSTGARISTLHRIGPIPMRLQNVAGARTLPELLHTSEDPFQQLQRAR